MQEHIKNELNVIVNRINSVVPTQSIYLFGSFAEERAQADSDFDLYVTLSNTDIRPIKAMQKINFALAQMDIRSIDVVAKSHDDFLQAAKMPTLERTVLEKGVKLYARS